MVDYANEKESSNKPPTGEEKKWYANKEQLNKWNPIRLDSIICLKVYPMLYFQHLKYQIIIKLWSIIISFELKLARSVTLFTSFKMISQ